MQKVTNKDGIVIKPGQVWRTVAIDVSGELVSVYANGDSLLMVNSDLKAYYPEKHIAHVLIQSHDGADLGAAEADGWEVWVEGMPPSTNYGEDGWQAWVPEAKTWVDCGKGNWPVNGTYRYKLKEETPKYKLFEIDWKADGGPFINLTFVVTSEDQRVSLEPCLLVDGYRIFGFTDHDDWTVRTEKTIEEHGSEYCAVMDVVPCDHAGNSKYAIGRLEQ